MKLIKIVYMAGFHQKEIFLKLIPLEVLLRMQVNDQIRVANNNNLRASSVSPPLLNKRADWQSSHASNYSDNLIIILKPQTRNRDQRLLARRGDVYVQQPWAFWYSSLFGNYAHARGVVVDTSFRRVFIRA